MSKVHLRLEDLDFYEDFDEDANADIEIKIDGKKEEHIITNNEVGDYEYDLDDLIIPYDEIDESYYLLYEAERKKEEENKCTGGKSRIMEMMREYEEKQELEKNRKKERQRLYKSDKKCYNIYEDDKMCQREERFARKKETRINMKKVKRLLNNQDITQEELAKLLGISTRSLNRKLNLDTDFTANEFVELADILKVDITDLINKYKY